MGATMKIQLIPAVIVSVACTCFISTLRADNPASAANASMTKEERAKVIKQLKDSEARTIEALEKCTDEQLKFKPAPDKWSVLEVGEHIALSEDEIFGAVQKAIDSGVNPDWEAKTKGKSEFLEKAILDRSHKVQAPEKLVPSGKLSRKEVIEKIKEERGKTIKFAEKTRLPLKSYTLDHPAPIFGTMSAYQWLELVGLHNMRHNLQIDEVMANPNFPKSTAKNE
jgi:DinB superfamily